MSLTTMGIVMPNGDTFSALETIKGTEKDSNYFVIAKSQNLVLGIRPLIFVMKTNGVFHLGARLRAVLENMDGDLSTAATVFNFPEGFHAKQTHTSMVAGMPVAESPFSPTELNLIIKQNNLVEEFAKQILDRLIEKEITPLISKELLVEVLNVTYDTELAEKIKKPMEFKAIFGLQ